MFWGIISMLPWSKRIKKYLISHYWWYLRWKLKLFRNFVKSVLTFPQFLLIWHIRNTPCMIDTDFQWMNKTLWKYNITLLDSLWNGSPSVITPFWAINAHILLKNWNRDTKLNIWIHDNDTNVCDEFQLFWWKIEEARNIWAKFSSQFELILLIYCSHLKCLPLFIKWTIQKNKIYPKILISCSNFS